MGRVVILHEVDFRGIGVVGLHEPVHKVRVIALIFGRRDLLLVSPPWSR